VRVVIVAEWYPSPADPVHGIWAHRQAAAARDAGAEVRVLALRRPVPPLSALRALAASPPDWGPFEDWRHGVRSTLRRTTIDGIDITPVPFVSPPRPRSYGSWGWWMAPPLGRALDRLRAQWPYDVIHTHNVVPTGHAAAVTGAGRRRRRNGGRNHPAALVVSTHGPDVIRVPKRGPAARRALGHALTCADLVMANSTWAGRRCAELAPHPIEPRVVHLGADMPDELPAKRDRPTLVTLAHLQPRKRHADVLRAMARLRGTLDLDYLIIGDGETRRPLEALAAELGLTERVTFAGQLAHARALRAAWECHLLVGGRGRARGHRRRRRRPAARAGRRSRRPGRRHRGRVHHPGAAGRAGRGRARYSPPPLHLGALRGGHDPGISGRDRPRGARGGRRPMTAARPDLLLLSLGTTGGLRVGDATFVALAREAGADVVAVSTRIGLTGRLRRAYPVTDIVEAFAARRALRAALRRHHPRAVVVSSTTAAMLAPAIDRPFAVRLDAPAAMNRTGRGTGLLHGLERRRLARATLVLPWSVAAAAALPPGSAKPVVVPTPVVPSGPSSDTREPLAVSYAPDPKARGLELLIDAWNRVEVPGARLEVFGIEADRAHAYLARFGIAPPPSVEWRGRTSPADFRATLRRAQVFVSAAQWEDYGLAPLEALADGALLVTTAAEGPYAALPIARKLDPLLAVGQRDPDQLAAALRRALRYPAGYARDYRAAAASEIAPYAPEAVVTTRRKVVLPALLG
jgi:teichuronic acid biosynthesis glycosyltransferase TuaC